jgi:hypothetical protein
MASKIFSIPSAAEGRRRKLVEATALLTLRPLSAGEMLRVSRVLAAEGIEGLHAARVRLTPRDAEAVNHGDMGPVSARIIKEHLPDLTDPDAALAEALGAAQVRGAALKNELLADPEMLNTASMAERLGV